MDSSVWKLHKKAKSRVPPSFRGVPKQCCLHLLTPECRGCILAPEIQKVHIILRSDFAPTVLVMMFANFLLTFCVYYLDNKPMTETMRRKVLHTVFGKYQSKTHVYQTYRLGLIFQRPVPVFVVSYRTPSWSWDVPFSKTPAELLIKNPKCGYQLQIGTDCNFENDLLAGFSENHLPLTSKSLKSLQGEGILKPNNMEADASLSLLWGSVWSR